MSGKVACEACGAMILPSTAKANDGVCMPCKRGDRGHIETAKIRYAERKKAQATPEPETLHWRWLVQQVHQSPHGFAGLSAENQNYFAACLLEGEVYDGGFDQYFHNSSADHYADAIRGLQEIGAAECSRLVVAAKEVLFGADDVPGTQDSRCSRIGEMAPALEDKLEELDRQFGKESARLRHLAGQYARKHGLLEEF
ncbi:MAG: hypothetical protein JWQ17_4412 [Tardiphaga sp.]|nr:hypothetical protein [Tardiphaga sp.]